MAPVPLQEDPRLNGPDTHLPVDLTMAIYRGPAA